MSVFAIILLIVLIVFCLVEFVGLIQTIRKRKRERATKLADVPKAEELPIDTDTKE